ncbi:ribosome recycling factor domain-containing protein [Cyathus striatus]|nr:ribosome recycling factor domain-containing protein [Cyathus striatus]
MSLLRLALRATPRPPLLHIQPTPRILPTRTFTTTPTLLGKKDKKAKKSNFKSEDEEEDFIPEEDEPRIKSKKDKSRSTDSFVPGSQLRVEPAAQEEYSKADTGMRTAVEWFRKECSATEVRMSGRVNTSILSPVRVVVGAGEGEEYTSRLEEVATVGIKDGTMLLVTPFEEKNMKAIEKGIWDASIPGVAPQRVDARTIKIPIARPTIQARQELYQAAKKKAEEIRVQVRKQLQASLKKGGWAKRSVEVDEFQKLCDRHVADIDKILEGLQKVSGGK